MSHITELETFDLEPGLVVRISANVFAEILHLYPDWLKPNFYRINFSNQRYDDSYEDTKTWEVISEFPCHSKA